MVSRGFNTHMAVSVVERNFTLNWVCSSAASRQNVPWRRMAQVVRPTRRTSADVPYFGRACAWCNIALCSTCAVEQCVMVSHMVTGYNRHACCPLCACSYELAVADSWTGRHWTRSMLCVLACGSTVVPRKHHPYMTPHLDVRSMEVRSRCQGQCTLAVLCYNTHPVSSTPCGPSISAHLTRHAW